ncbi:MAG TPA: hypothetical protein VGX96_19975 [Candidatus Elarobacter sp.]|jgi:tyrosinase|nr:hypothetical protein [Candidatus Elarobacter sp.]
MASLKSGAPVASFPVGELGSDFQRGEVRFDGLTLPSRSFEVRVFLDEPNANAQTPTEGNPKYLGTQYFYGVGPGSSAGAGAALESAKPHSGSRNRQLAPTQIKLNVTDKLRTFAAQAENSHVPMTLVAVDHDGNEIAEPGLNFEGLSLVTS